MNFDFKKEKISHSEALKYWEFFKLSELINLFNDKKIKNLQDYMYGIEVGLNANGRKNRGGKLMESMRQAQCWNFYIRTLSKKVSAASPVILLISSYT